MKSVINNKKKLEQVFRHFTNFPPNIADLAQQKLYINANLYGTQATVCSMYYCRVKCKKAQPDFAQFSSTAFNIFRAYEKYSDKNEVAAGNENPIVNMLILEMKVGVNNSIIYKNERLFPISDFSAPEEKRKAYLLHERHSTQIANHSKSTAFIGRRACGIDCQGK